MIDDADRSPRVERPFARQGSAFSLLKAEHSALLQWLFDYALPIWSTRGVDSGSGGFFEKLTQDGRVIEEPRRTRLASRQIYVFASAVELGWEQEERSRKLVLHGLDFLLDKCVSVRGTVHSEVLASGQVVKPEFDLYDHAFALFALAVAARLDYRRDLAVATGRRMRDAMVRGWKHPQFGFEESMPPSEPLNANQHMHLLEAFLEWEAARDDYGWTRLADEVVELALSRFVDPATGGVREHYDHEWRPLGDDRGRYLEPGHQFEWAWLLWRWSVVRERIDILDKVRRLAELGEEHGISKSTGLAVDGLWADLSLRDGASRLWPQTERIKANIAVAESTADGDEAQRSMRRAAGAAHGLRLYHFKTSTAGLWHETIGADGKPVPGACKASSLYHIVCAIQELDRFIGIYDRDA